MISIVILSLWTIGNNIIIMLAGIQDIPQSYYESAQIDGAGSLRQTFLYYAAFVYAHHIF
ncbi:MAG: hypothetical protein ACLRIL_07135 [Fusicatenibacter saccharivorans]